MVGPLPAHPASRLPFLLPGIACLIVGILTGLARMSVSVPDFAVDRAAWHSALMISGFFGTVIALERAVALGKTWAYLAPLLSGLGGLTLLTPAYAAMAPVLFGAAALCFTFASILVVIKQPAIYTAILLAGAVLWLGGNTLWLLSGDAWSAIPYGLSFLVLTIAGERLELTRFLPPKKYARLTFLMIVTVLVFGTLASGASHFGDATWLGIGYAALALWLLVYDIARKTIRKSGITRFVAVCLLSGYLWLLIGGLLATPLWQLGPFQRDASIHAIVLGFIFAMVIGHAPIIFPAVMRVRIPFSPIFYMPLGLIQAGVTLRLLAALLNHTALREAGGIVSGIAILAFFLSLLFQISRGLRQS